MGKIRRIRTGGQTGVDRATLDAARELGIPIAGWIPKGGLAEDYAKPPGLLSAYPETRETPLADVNQRTEWNVRDADATLIIMPPTADSRGTNWTIECAKRYNKPYFVTDGRYAKPIINWLSSLPDDIELNVGGPRESEAWGIYSRTRNLMHAVLKEQTATHTRVFASA
jgi:hypothetical protein